MIYKLQYYAKLRQLTITTYGNDTGLRLLVIPVMHPKHVRKNKINQLTFRRTSTAARFFIISDTLVLTCRFLVRTVTDS